MPPTQRLTTKEPWAALKCDPNGLLCHVPCKSVSADLIISARASDAMIAS